MGLLAFTLGYRRYGIVDANNPTGGLGVNFNYPDTPVLSSAIINTPTTGDNTIVAGVSLQTIRMHKLFLVASAATIITFKDGSGTALTGPITLSTGGAMVFDLDGEPWFLTSAGNGLVINQTGTAQLSGRVYYKQS